MQIVSRFLDNNCLNLMGQNPKTLSIFNENFWILRNIVIKDATATITRYHMLIKISIWWGESWYNDNIII